MRDLRSSIVWQILLTTSGSISIAMKARTTALIEEAQSQPVEGGLGGRQNYPLAVAVKLKAASLVGARPGDANQTVPTGFSGLPPAGPAIPVMPNPMLAPVFLRIPRDISSAVGSLTAPCFSNVAGFTPRNLVFASLA